MAGEWPTLSLREAHVKLIDCDHRTPPAAEEGYPYVAIPQLRNGRINLSEARRISREHFADWTRKAMPAANDVVLSRRCNPGETAFVSPGLEFALGQNLVLLRADGVKVYPPFLRWLVQGPEWWEQIGKFLNVGAVFDSLRCVDVPNFELHIPPMPEQRAIAHILGTLDDRIELNRRMNETLEAMARTLFKSWFVDFDPVRAKAAGRDLGLPKHVADLFPDSFKDSELGEIPMGWKARSLYETAEFINGAAFKSEDFCDPSLGLPIVKIAELKDDIGAQTKFSDRVLDPKQLIDTGELLYSWSGSPDTSLDAFLWTKGRGLLNQHIFKVITPAIAEKRFVYYLLKFLKPTLVEIARNKQTTGLGHVTVADMKRLYVCSPAQNVLAAFDNQVAPLFNRAFKVTLQNQTLVALRDALLPKLISGEFRVGDAERIVEIA